MSTATGDFPAYSPGPEQPPLRFVTAASLFDGHDAAINIMRRLIQAQGVEVVHLGHNRSVADVVAAALQEDADGIAVSSYQGGHLEYFRYMVDMLKENGADHVRVFGGGGGTITPEEIAELQAYGVERIYHPNDGLKLGLVPMIEDLVTRCQKARRPLSVPDQVGVDQPHSVARMISAIEAGLLPDGELQRLRREWQMKGRLVPVIGITGTGGAGKSSVTDELLNRFLQYLPDKRCAVLAVDPTRRRTGGALLGDRIRMNTLRDGRIFMRSMATRRQHLATSETLSDCIALLRSVGFDLVFVETAGIGQSDSEIVDLVNFSVYVMTSDYGAASQLEKIDMLDFAELVVLNKYDRPGAADALRDVRKQWQRNHVAFDTPLDEVPVYPAIASQFNDPGTTWMFANLCRRVAKKCGLDTAAWTPVIGTTSPTPVATALIPGNRQRYLAEIAEEARALNGSIRAQAANAHQAQHYYESLRAIADPSLPEVLEPYADQALTETTDPSLGTLRQCYQKEIKALTPEALELLRAWPERYQGVRAERYSYRVRGREVGGDNYRKTLSQQRIPKIAPPKYQDWGELLEFLMMENLPGAYPYTGGVYPYRRLNEDPIRMFAGEGPPERTNRRFHYLSAGHSSVRLSTAFDSVTLYGEDPHRRPDIYGKVGNSGVSIATVDDIKKLYSGFDLCDPDTSVSMTINGPAPMILAFFMNAAIDQQVEAHLKGTGAWEAASKRMATYFKDRQRPVYEGALPSGNDGFGLGTPWHLR